MFFSWTDWEDQTLCLEKIKPKLIEILQLKKKILTKKRPARIGSMWLGMGPQVEMRTSSFFWSRLKSTRDLGFHGLVLLGLNESKQLKLNRTTFFI